MSIQKFAQHIDDLLWTGAIEGEEIFKLYHLLKAYEHGKISAEAMQTAINQHDPDQVEQWLNDHLPPLSD